MSNVITICGSLRKGSFNRMLANLLPSLAPSGMTIKASPSIEMPLYNSDGGGAMFPTGRLVDELDVPGVGRLRATMINAGIPTVFVEAAALGYDGTELQGAINGDAQALARFEAIRAHAALQDSFA